MVRIDQGGKKLLDVWLLLAVLAICFPVKGLADEQSDPEKKREADEQEELDDEIDTLEEDNFPDLVPADERGGLKDEIDTLEEDNFPDLVGVGEKGELMDEFAFLEEAGTVELAARHRQALGMSPSAITVITREDIAASGATTIPDLLRLVPGMDALVVSPFVTAVSTRLMWTYENSNFLVLVDNREVNVELLGMTYYEAQPFLVEDIERIEIIRGPASSLYGANAFAGVISITTRTIPDKTVLSARLIAGEMSTLTAATRAASTLGKLGFSLTAGVDRSGSFNEQSVNGKHGEKLHALAEYALADSNRLVLDFSLASSEGVQPATAGTIDTQGSFYALRLAYESEPVKAQLFWNYGAVIGRVTEPIVYAGIHLADFASLDADGHTLDTDLQWNVPTPWEPLLLIVGAGGRLSRVAVDNALDAHTFADNTSPRYHQIGIVHWEGRGGAFVHGEISPVEWMTLTGGFRSDYNTETGISLSPRLAAVFKPAEDQFLRLGVARAFRKPSFAEQNMHPGVTFPADSPLQAESAQNLFQEFMLRCIGGETLGNEQLLAFEAGYLGQFLDDRLSVSLDLYVNLYEDVIQIKSDMVPDPRGLPDLRRSSFLFAPVRNMRFFGGELMIRYAPSRKLSLLASWAYREGFVFETGRANDENPKHLLSLGGRFLADSGLLGSLYLFSRSEFRQTDVPNPGGLFEPQFTQRLPNVIMCLSRIGWRQESSMGLTVETGLKLFLPIALETAPTFAYFEVGGGFTPFGVGYGGQRLHRVLQAYLEGTF